MRVFEPVNGRKLSGLWTPTLAHYSAYSLAEVAPVVAQVADIVAKATMAMDSSTLTSGTVG